MEDGNMQMTPEQQQATDLQRRSFMKVASMLGSAGALSMAGAGSALASMVTLPFANGRRQITNSYPQKKDMILMRERGPLLETPFDVFNHGVLTPNDRYFVRWHYAAIPTHVDVNTFRLRVHGAVSKTLDLSLNDIIRNHKPHEFIAVNQCSGNSRGFFTPRVAGGEWANGAMGCSRWTGVPLRDILNKAGVKSDALQIRFHGLDKTTLAESPRFMKSLDVGHAMDGEVMVAYAMNGEPLPLLNGFPIRLIVPGWYATYWVKSLDSIEVLTAPDTNFWMKVAYTIPDTPRANITPGQTGFKMIPINRMVPRSFITNLHNGTHVRAGHPVEVRGIAFGGDQGVAKVLFSDNGGQSWHETRLEHDYGRYAFRRWHTSFKATRGAHTLMVKCVNTKGLAQPMTPNWNPAGFMRNVVETTRVVGA